MNYVLYDGMSFDTSFYKTKKAAEKALKELMKEAQEDCLSYDETEDSVIAKVTHRVKKENFTDEKTGKTFFKLKMEEL